MATTKETEMEYTVNASKKYGAYSVTCKACRKAKTIDTRTILWSETPEDAWRAHQQTTYHRDTIGEHVYTEAGWRASEAGR